MATKISGRGNLPALQAQAPAKALAKTKQVAKAPSASTQDKLGVTDAAKANKAAAAQMAVLAKSAQAQAAAEAKAAKAAPKAAKSAPPAKAAAPPVIAPQLSGSSYIAGSGPVVVDINRSDSGYQNRISWSDDGFATRHSIGIDNQTASVENGTFVAGTRIEFGIDNGQGNFFRTGGAAANADAWTTRMPR